MTNADKQLLVRAISEGLVQKYEEEMSIIEKHPRCSKQHYEKMSEIIGFKVKTPCRITKKGIGAILLAAALLLMGCAIYSEEIRDFFVEIYETHIEVTFDNGKDQKNSITETYELSFMLDGYVQTKETNTRTVVSYKYTNPEEHVILFEQIPLDGLIYRLDAERGDYTFLTIGEHRILYKYSDQHHLYIWTDDKYALSIYSDIALTDDELAKLVGGIKINM